MNKTIMKRITALLLAAAIVAGIWVAMPNDRDSYAGETVIATPTIQKIGCSKTSNGDGSVEGGPTYSYPGYRFTFNGKETTYWRNTDLSKYMPIYSIKQSNGYGANYVKLRDIAFFADFNVQWSFSDPNAMYIWTNNHYAEEPKLSGPATETKVGEWSTYDIYVDGVKVEGLQPVLIDDNNYFKIRDIARIVNLGCIYDITTEKVYIEGDLQYVEENELQNYGSDAKAWLENSPKRSVTFQHVRPTYGYPSGTVAASPVTLTENDPWARENYFDKYASQELKDFLGYDPSSNGRDQIELERNEVAWFNASVQLILDENIADDPNYCLPQANAPGAGYCVYVKNIDSSGYAVKLGAINSNFLLTNMDSIKADIDALGSDRERIAYLTKLVCRKITYAGAGAQYNSVKEKLSFAGFGMYDSGYDASVVRHEQGGDYYLNWETQEGSVCEGYAAALQYLCMSLGYYVAPAGGSVRGGSHAWSEVWLPDEGKWVGVDATFADRIELTLIVDTGEYIMDGYVDEEYVCWDIDAETAPHKNGKEPMLWGIITEEILKTAFEIKPQAYMINPRLNSVE